MEGVKTRERGNYVLKRAPPNRPHSGPSGGNTHIGLSFIIFQIQLFLIKTPISIHMESDIRINHIGADVLPFRQGRH